MLRLGLSPVVRSLSALSLSALSLSGLFLSARAVAQVPGVLLLVPGSIGYRSLSSLLDQNVIVGVTAAFTMILTAVAIAAGLLVASVLVPTHRQRSTTYPGT